MRVKARGAKLHTLQANIVYVSHPPHTWPPINGKSLEQQHSMSTVSETNGPTRLKGLCPTFVCAMISHDAKELKSGGFIPLPCALMMMMMMVMIDGDDDDDDDVHLYSAVTQSLHAYCRHPRWARTMKK